MIVSLLLPLEEAPHQHLYGKKPTCVESLLVLIKYANTQTSVQAYYIWFTKDEDKLPAIFFTNFPHESLRFLNYNSMFWIHKLHLMFLFFRYI